MPTERQVRVGDLYYSTIIRDVFKVVSKKPGVVPNSWIMSNGPEGYTVLMHADPQSWWRYSETTDQDFKVVIGSTWYRYGNNDLFTVVRPNVNQEAGPDSWVMEDMGSHKTLYMHHRRRIKGEWLHVSAGNTIVPTLIVRRSRYHRSPVI